ncbi:nitroreductase/quinone reductase family protein [Williamsia sp. MIQD14]|uniref:nitroreductase/quinone reductase family protein n=1 Tax=Williamsia sp. MIQD14 TaxID=3425703 RepID=UPI003DA0DA84
MGLLTPLAVRIGAIGWMPKALPLIEKTDSRLQRVTHGRVSLLDIAGLPNLLLRVPGRKSGVLRSTPLLCAPRSADEWLIAGSYFGNPKTPTWVYNLRATDSAEIVVDGTPIAVSWREAGDDRPALWAELLDVWPNFRLYEQRTDRTIPVFVLTRR